MSPPNHATARSLTTHNNAPRTHDQAPGWYNFQPGGVSAKDKIMSMDDLQRTFRPWLFRNHTVRFRGAPLWNARLPYFRTMSDVFVLKPLSNLREETLVSVAQYRPPPTCS